MPKAYAPEFRRRVIELARSGRRVTEIATQFGVSQATTYRWIAQAGDQLLVVVSSLLIGKKKSLVKEAVQDLVSQATPTPRVKTAFWPAQSDPCLQLADYATWAIHRKNATGKSDAFSYIEDRVEAESLLFKKMRTTLASASFAARPRGPFTDLLSDPLVPLTLPNLLAGSYSI